MRIVANNERERELFEKFVDFISDYIDSKEMQSLIETSVYSFEDHEIDFLQTGFYQSTIEVDKEIWEIMSPSDNLFGICKYCNKQWNGVEDERELNIYDYERFLNLGQEDSYHAECLRMNECVNCGSDDDTEKVEDEGMMCESCREEYGYYTR